MATETETKQPTDAGASHRRSVTITAIASLGGVIAGVGSFFAASTATDTVAVLILVVALLAEQGLMKLLGIDVEEFSAKDNLYVVFETFAFWFITWGVLLSTGI